MLGARGMLPSKKLGVTATWMMMLPLILLLLPGCSYGWHDFTNVDFHCWPASASESNAATLSDCTGVDVDWITPPPQTIKAEEHFNVSFRLTMDDSFWDWAITEDSSSNKINFFDYLGISNSTVAKDWCLNTVCPSDISSVSSSTCCIHHVNVHSCPLEDSPFCGPWITATGTTYTHSEVLWGQGSQEEWFSTVAGLYAVGTTQLIAHFKYANFQIVLFYNVVVEPRSECGNDICEGEDGEDCSTCPADCGKCPFKMPLFGIVLASLGCAALVIIFAGTFGYIRYKNQKMLWDESWIIPEDEIKNAEANPGVFGSCISMTTSGSNNMGEAALSRQIFTKTGLVNGRTVAIRDVKKNKFTLTKATRIEVKTVRSLDHVNLNKFAGACIVPDHFCVVWNYCPKGAMSDILLNQSIPINWAFRFSFCSDICRGMSALHQHDVIHGRLKSNNCIVDDRWTVKITDYGVLSLRTPDEIDDEDDEAYKDKQAIVYKPPESICSDFEPTPAGDLYAFGIILIEIATRDDPYGDEDRMMLPAGWKPPLPDLYEGVGDAKCPAPKEYQDLITQCLNTDPSLRLTFPQANSSIKKMNPSKKSPVDLMMAMMEKYSKHLEAIVSERTADLMVEKQKTDRLLYSMLPRAVADQLRQGHVIGAEQYESCTIYFSDIVGFTAISGKSVPMEVVALLNKLYTAFDSIIEKYDVYKVETIGDAYMVVSGVPIKNGIEHARQVSLMALDLVKESETFIIPHLPKEKLKIRVGLHSGGVCAGVVGLKMPRYCLFGDTVNTASRMESNGEAYKIHISNFTYEHLARIGGFKLESRGVIPVKGKGDMKTWWLNGYNGPPATAQDLLKRPSLAHLPPELKAKLSPSSPVPSPSPSPSASPPTSPKNNNKAPLKVQPAEDNDLSRKVSTGNDSGFNEGQTTTFDTDALVPIED